MLKNYCRIIIRQLWRNKLYTLINIAGLGIGIAAIIWGFQNYRFSFSYDNFHNDPQHIFRVLIKIDGSDDLKGPCPRPLAGLAKNDFPIIRQTVRWDSRNLNIKAAGSEAFSSRVNFTDPAFFDIFNFPLARGAIRLADPSTVLITGSAAKKIFGEEDPVGKTLTFYSDQPYGKPMVVTGILKDPPINSTLQFEIITHINNLAKPNDPPIRDDDWRFFCDAVFVKLSDAGGADKLSHDLDKYVPLETAARKDIKIRSFNLRSLPAMATQSVIIDKNALDSRPGDAAAYGPLVLGILILLSASLNFANTSVAQCNRRLKEMGVRKVLGGSFRQIMLQQLLECSFIVLLAIGLSVVINNFWLPAYNALFVYLKVTAHYFSDLPLLAFLAFLFLAVTLFAGAYPALYISRFNATNIFRGSLKFGGNNLFSRLLLGLQVVISFITVIAGVAFSRNATFQRNYDYGYATAGVMGLSLPGGTSYTTVRDELRSLPGIQEIAGSCDLIGFSYHSFALEGGGVKKEVSYLDVGPGYTGLMGLKLVAGRNFYLSGDNDYGQALLINEKLAFLFGWKPQEAIGQQIRKDDATVCTVVGVLKDFTQNSLFDPIQPLAISLVPPDQASQLVIRCRPAYFGKVQEKIRKVWTGIYPGKPLNIFYQDQIMSRTYRTNESIARIFLAFAVISIFMAATGMFALVSLTVLKKNREIAIRKVVGAKAWHILFLVLKGYFRIFFVSALLGCLAGYSFSRLLMDMIFRINAGVSPSSLTLSFAGVLLISALTVGSRIWALLHSKASEVLKAE
jgi:ABC-type antimicrobial peptide transport system permease subunit